jgi:hypothetical protein
MFAVLSQLLGAANNKPFGVIWSRAHDVAGVLVWESSETRRNRRHHGRTGECDSMCSLFPSPKRLAFSIQAPENWCRYL